MRCVLMWAAVCWATACFGRAEDSDLLIADFEGPDYGAWVTTGMAFGPRPAHGTLANQMEVTGYEGKGLVNSYYEGDNATGTLTSPPFIIERPYINFLLGGGKYPNEACINLLVGDQVVRTATGPNDRAGGTESLDWYSWDVEDLIGKQAVIQIVDRRQGGWGHINVDHIVQSNQRREVGPATRQLTVEHRYLHFPVKKGAAVVRMKVTAADKVVDDFDIELASGTPDFWTFLDMQEYRGQEATIEVVRLPSDSQGLSQVTQADEVPGAATLYREKYRPQFHFSPRVGWNNDPNGLVFYRGEWHLYFQHNPYGWGWGNMHWGHAVSPNLVHWTELPIAIYPFEYGDWVFSGGAVVDTNNTAGFKTGDNDVIVASYTSTGRGEAIAYSNDRGRTFVDFEGNPVIKHQGRDPKIIWYAPGKHWVMAVYDEEGTGNDQKQRIAFYSSPDLKQWTLQSKIDGYFECPEIFELSVEGNQHESRWVLYAADGAYQLGSFDGKVFTPEHAEKHRYNWGNCFYASQTYSNVPPKDGRRIQVAWGQIGSPEMPFNQQMNFPVQLTLHATDEGLRMFANPVQEIAQLREKSVQLDAVSVTGDTNPLDGQGGELLHIQCAVEPGTAKEIVFDVRGEKIAYDAAQQQLVCRDKRAPLPLVDGRIQLEFLVDRMSIEIFGNAGRIYMPMGMVLDVDNEALGVSTTGGTATIQAMSIHRLKSAWQREDDE
ncbi:MAG: GH32 C-terminal domain-containing protein [Pirellulaceae bacterium]